jgi:arginyl-tRNA synthetase
MKKEVQKIVADAIKNLQKSQKLADFEVPEIGVEYAKNEKYGDYATNIAMVLGKLVKKNPMEIAEEIVDVLKKEPSPLTPLPKGEEDIKNVFENIEVAAPGYINFYLSKKYLQNKVEEINNEKENFGNSEIGKGKKINNEFISANPTGPLHLGNGRGGFCGDSLGKVLRKSGYEVVNEFYVNDFGGQVVKLGHSVLKDAEAVYAGEYIEELNKKLGDGTDVKETGMKAAEIILNDIIKKTIAEKMQITFDSWVSEKTLHEEKYVDRAIEMLVEKKLTYEKDGAVWLKTTDFGDDKDRVLVKSDGQKAYIASDCGYILNKIERKFDKMIEIWGADHHGYVNRFRAAAQALGFSGELKFIIVQLVRLMKDGKEAKMSKRAGNVVSIDELIDKVGHDVTLFFFLMYSADAHMNFDLGLAEEKSQKNPVYYVQYAHARICSILRKSQISNLKSQKELDLSLLSQEKELSLMKELNKFPELVEEISKNYEVHKLPYYAIKLADKFHSFYADCRVIDEANPELTQARLSLVNAVRIVLAETLRLIGVSAPEKM